MESLIRAYIACGGDPNDLLQSLQEAPPPLAEDEARFFKQYEDEMGQ
jgi:hypothetical protein